MYPAQETPLPPDGANVPAIDAGAVPKGGYLLDVREPNEWLAGHAPDAIHIPMRDVIDRADELPCDREIYVVCRTGTRSARVTKALCSAGSYAVNVEGGMVRWEAKGRPLVSETQASPFVGWPYKPEISYEEFAKVDLRAAQIIGAELVENKRNYVLLSVDLGFGQRQMVAAKGLPELYPPSDLVGRTVVWLANMSPKKIVGHMSEGMILTVGDDRVIGLALIDNSVRPGAQVR